MHLFSLRTGLFCYKRGLKDMCCSILKLLKAVNHLYSTTLTPASSMDLGLYHPWRAFQVLARLMGLAVGLSGLTAWALHRFDTARHAIELPPIGDAGYEQAANVARAQLTADALAETFLFSAAVAAVAMVVALWLRRRRLGSAGAAKEPLSRAGTEDPSR